VTEAPSRTRLPHVLAVLYALAVAYVSLQPFGPWLAPPPGTSYFLLPPWPTRVTRYDIALNLVAYAPLGLFVGLLPRRARPSRRILVAFAAGGVLALVMESLQMLEPPRDANPWDLAFNALGALLGGMAAAVLARSPRFKRVVGSARARWIVPGQLGDVGLGLLVLWLFAQMNPAIPLFAVVFHASPLAPPEPLEGAAFLIEAATSAFQLIGVGLFVALLVRGPVRARHAVLALIGAALLLKLAASAVMLRPESWHTWVKPEVLAGIAAGALLLPLAIAAPRPVQVALCGIALLASVGAPMLEPESLAAPAPLGLFEWRYGQLLNYNGLTHTALLIWPLLAATWLLGLAGRPGWGRANEPA
jgi:VanZ family protein